METFYYKQRLSRFLVILCCLSGVSACADVYEWRDDIGNSHYSDRARDNSKKLSIKSGYAYALVDKVFDGDTIRLADGRKVRFLGINTPEVQHRNQSGQAGGEAAKTWLTKTILNRKVRLVGDVEAEDKYHRTLAHVFTESNEHINLQLVENGLAAVDIHTPNLLFAEQLAAAQNRAERAGRGIWGRAEYDPFPANQLTEDGHAGWLRLTGKVKTLRNSRKFVYLEFSEQFQARIEKRWLELFPDLNTFVGKNVEVRGWLNKNRGNWSMLLRHSSAIKVL